MDFITTTLLAGGVMCISYGINQNDLIITIVGGILLGIYNSIYYNKIWYK